MQEGDGCIKTLTRTTNLEIPDHGRDTNAGVPVHYKKARQELEMDARLLLAHRARIWTDVEIRYPRRLFS